MTFDAVGIGWDVCGWQGNTQAVAIVGWAEGTLHWIGCSPAFRFSSRQSPTLSSLLLPVLQDPVAVASLLAVPHITLGIDAPLSFPPALGDLLSGRPAPCTVPEREIDNPYAYRDCERWLYQRYGKKPLSATFDRLGNNATLAMALLKHWRVPVAPLQSAGEGELVAIETYPAMAKMAGRISAAHPGLLHVLPDGIAVGTDIYDAALCALMALQHAMQGQCHTLPALVTPVDSHAGDGWIYHFDLARS